MGWPVEPEQAAAEGRLVRSFGAAELGAIEAARGNREAARNVLDQLESAHSSGALRANAYRIAKLHAAMGNRREILRWLETSYRRRDGDLAMINVDPAFDSLRDDPVFRSFLRRTGLGL